jgi:F-type H+-transporting ATPase subunit beta
MPTIQGHISQIIGPVVDVHFDLKGVQEEKSAHCDDSQVLW